MKSLPTASEDAAMMPRRVGEILDHGFTVLRSTLPRLAIVLVLFAAFDTAEVLFWTGGGAVKLLGILLNIAQWVVSLSYVFLLGAEWQGRPISLGQALNKTTFSFIVKSMTLSLRVGLMSALYGMLLLIPGIVYFLNRVLAFTCIYFEEVSVPEALDRSKFLMTQEKWYSLSGAKMRYGSLILVSIVLNLAISGMTALFLGAVDAYVGGPISGPLSYASLFVNHFLTQLLYLYAGIVGVGFYFDLRTRYEALDLIGSPE